jgi:uncharacterized protein CbrC (UPF0167 family)
VLLDFSEASNMSNSLLSILELEERMRPGAMSVGGFLGPTESLEAVLAKDRHTLEEAQVTYDQVADALERVLQSAHDQQQQLSTQEVEKRHVELPALCRPWPAPRFSLDHLPDPEKGYCVEGTLQVFFTVYRGFQCCPWCGDSTWGCFDFLILNRRSGEYITGPGLIVHLIREHQFFEGSESPYRVEPLEAIRVLELGSGLPKPIQPPAALPNNQFRPAEVPSHSSGLSLTVSHWPARLIGVAGVIVFALFSALAIAANSPCGMIFFIPATLACIPLALLYGQTTMNQWGIMHSAPLGRYALAWDEMSAVVLDIGDNTIVFKGEKKQLVLPALNFWAGRDKPAMKELMRQELKRRGIKISKGFAAFAMSRGCRVKRPLDQQKTAAADQGDLPVQPPADALQLAGEYNLVNICQMLLAGFTEKRLRRLVHSEPSLRAVAEELRPEYPLFDMADTIVAWASAHGKIRDLLAAAQRANPRMYAMHRPYHTQDRDQSPQQREDAMHSIYQYKLANIRRLLVEGFSADELRRLVRYDPLLKAIDEEFRPGDDVPGMADTIIDWGRTHLMFDAILTAAEHANPRMYAIHRPYHAQDREQPASRTTYDLGRIAALLEQIFDSESLYNFFRERAALGPVWTDISKEDHLSRMIYRVLAYAERRVMLGDLLTEVKAAYPEAYEQLKPYEAGIPEPTDRFKETNMGFEYFQGPTADMSGLRQDECVCSLCGETGQCFELDYAICPELGEEKEGKFGCFACLRAGRFEFWHDTDIGLLDENGLTRVYSHNQPAPPGFPDTALVALRRTPQFVTWQQELWLTHCNDFMVYQGTWKPQDFYRNAPDGDGRALFLKMTDHYPNLWDDSLLLKGETQLSSWHATYYVFRCRHCGTLKGNWDCD